MGIIVQKFGGSSVADTQKLQQVAQQVVARYRAGHQLVVVVSAMGKTTDGLIALAREISAQPPRRELDMLVSVGERISMALLSMAIIELGVQAISFTGSQSGIITDDNHQTARILEIRPQRIEAELKTGRIVIVAGYQGMSRAREVTTLGRGGSDTTAVALAAALKAEACEIYSDVDGVYTTDPQICPAARLLPAIDYDMMAAMSEAGAKVLNTQAVELARSAGVRVHARRTGDPSGRETVVAQDGASSAAAVGAVVLAQAVTWVQWDDTLDETALLAIVQKVGGRVLGGAGGSKGYLIDRTDIAGKDPQVLRRALEAANVSTRSTLVEVVTLVGASQENLQQAVNDLPAALATVAVEPMTQFGRDRIWMMAVAPGTGSALLNFLHERFIASEFGR